MYMTMMMLVTVVMKGLVVMMVVEVQMVMTVIAVVQSHIQSCRSLQSLSIYSTCQGRSLRRRLNGSDDDDGDGEYFDDGCDVGDADDDRVGDDDDGDDCYDDDVPISNMINTALINMRQSDLLYITYYSACIQLAGIFHRPFNLPLL